MTQEKEKKVPPTSETEEQKTPTPEEELSALRQQAQEATDKIAKLEKEAKAHQQAAFRATQERDEAREIRDEIESLRSSQRILAAMIDERSEAETLEPEKRQGYEKRFEELEKKTEAKRQSQKYQEKQAHYYDIVTQELGLKPSDKDFKVVQGLAISQDYDGADAYIEELKAKQAESPKEPEKSEETKETEDERVERLAKEKVAELLKSEGGTPSAPGTAITIEEFQALSPEERIKRLPDLRKSMEGK